LHMLTYALVKFRAACVVRTIELCGVHYNFYSLQSPNSTNKCN
jgi:hypothetical protein